VVSTITIRGFRIQSYGRLSAGFRRALKRLAAKHFKDESCVVVKTRWGNHSGMTHFGGRYVHPQNPYAQEVVRLVLDAGMNPPPPPFVVAPGACRPHARGLLAFHASDARDGVWCTLPLSGDDRQRELRSG